MNKDANGHSAKRSGLKSLQTLLAMSLIWAGPTLACGSFAPRPTPTPTSPPTALETGTENNTAVQPLATPIVQEAVDTPTPAPTATFTPTPEPGTALVVGQPARVTAPAGLNFRDEPNPGANLLGQLGTGQIVAVTEGPVAAADFIWWRLDDGEGNVGWAAEGDGSTEWLSPQIGEPQPVNRQPRVGERVVVSMPGNGQLSVRAQPGTNATLIRRVSSGTQYTVEAGPQTANGFTWFQIRSDDGGLVGWAADGDGSARWLSPLE